MEYQTLSLQDRLMLAKDRLRAFESDHFRLSLAHVSESEAAHLAVLEEKIKDVASEVSHLEEEAAAELAKWEAKAASD